jgi:proteic killer suppression protein
MIGSFRDKRLQRFYEAGDRSRLQPRHVERIESILASLEAAVRIEQLRLPRYRLHPLKGDLKGSWSIMVHANWRIVFRFDDGRAFDIDLVDYH